MSCSICFADEEPCDEKKDDENKVDTTSAFISTPCNHTFHSSCLDQWLFEHDTCPLCRFVLVSRPPELDDEIIIPDYVLVYVYEYLNIPFTIVDGNVVRQVTIGTTTTNTTTTNTVS